MKAFATLMNTIESTNKSNSKLEALGRFFDEAEEADKLWLLALFTGKRPKRVIPVNLIKQWAIEKSNIPEWLFQECYAAVGDLSETIALILPEANETIDLSLAEWMEILHELKHRNEEQRKQTIVHAWDHLPYIERFIFNKLIGGGFRIGISTQSLINAIAKKYSLEPSAVAHSIMGSWDVNKVRFAELIRGAYTNTEASKPYPFCLSYALDNKLDTLGAPSEWQVEYKWDGIRGQFIKRNGEVFIWSRGEELVTDQFPEIKNCLASWPENIVFDGEILAYKDNRVLHFSELQKRLNRKQVSAQLMKEVPIAVFAYDLIEWSFEDVRNKPLSERRKLLEQLILNHPNDPIYLSPIFSFTGWKEAEELRSNAERMHAEGIVLKHKNGIYHTGRKKGDWWKWKIDPQTIDAVLIYAQKGSGRRSGYYTDYTFAVKHNDQLVPIAKAYSGLTDKESQEVSNFINKNALEKFGPVRTVKPELVFEIAFEGISFSKRHKSGVALRS